MRPKNKQPSCLDMPSDWDSKIADDLCSKITKGTTPPKSEVSDNGLIPFIRINNLTVGGARSLNGDLIYVSEASHRGFLSRSIAYPDDILMNIVGPPLGKVVKLDDRFKEYNLNQAVLIFRPLNDGIDNEFLYYYITSNPCQNWLEARAKKTSGQKNLTIELCKSLPIPIPPKSEQERIVAIFRKWDEVIEKSACIISQKQKQKNALMQRLLSGKHRFPEFKGQEWYEAKIGDLLKIVKRPVQWSDEDQYNLLSVRRRSGGAFPRESRLGKDILTKNMSVALAGDFLISKMQVVHGAMALTPDKYSGMHISGSYISLVTKNPKNFDITFFDWLSRQSEMYHKAYRSSYGVHIEKMTFNLNLFLKEKICYPTNIEEQRKIVSVLNAADKEIDLLTQKLEAYQNQKKGLMQQLLTGKKRIKLDRKEAA